MRSLCDKNCRLKRSFSSQVKLLHFICTSSVWKRCSFMQWLATLGTHATISTSQHNRARWKQTLLSWQHRRLFTLRILQLPQIPLLTHVGCNVPCIRVLYSIPRSSRGLASFATSGATNVAVSETLSVCSIEGDDR